MGLLRLQNNPLVHVVSRNGLLCVACARRKVHLSARRHVGELPVAAAYGGASQKVIALHAAQDGARGMSGNQTVLVRSNERAAPSRYLCAAPANRGSARVALMRKSFIAVLLPSLLIVCGAQTPPTATEAFNLRIRCKQMADQKADALAWHDMTVAEGAFIGMSAADVARLNDQTRPEVLGSWSSSKYDAINNRCYVRIYQHTRRKSQYDYEVQQVYDAQVHELLAHAEIKDAKKSGTIWDQSYKGDRFPGGDAGWE